VLENKKIRGGIQTLTENLYFIFINAIISCESNLMIMLWIGDLSLPDEKKMLQGGG